MVISTQNTLVGWKAIAGYLSRDERTVMRWAASRGMPVRRVAGLARSSVYAWPADLDAWLGGAQSAPLPDAETPPPVAIPNPQVKPTRTWWWPTPLVSIIVLGVAAIAAWLSLRAGTAPPDPAPSGLANPMPNFRDAPNFHDANARASFLQAQFDWNLRTRASLLRAVDEFGDAAAHDPGIAASYVGIANSYLLLREYAAMPDGEAYARASAAAKIAINLDPRSMDARRSLAFIAFWWDGDIAAAGRQFAEALAIAPGDPLTHHWLANALAANGEAAAAFHEITTARALDPVSGSVLIDYGVIAYAAGHRPESARVLNMLVDADPQDAELHRELATIALFERRDADYLREAARAAALRHDPSEQAAIAGQAADFAQGGAPLMLDKMVDAARDRARTSQDGFFALARIAALSGRTVAAIDALAPACARREHDAIAAPGDLWLSRAVSSETMHRLCPRPALIDAMGKGGT